MKNRLAPIGGLLLAATGLFLAFNAMQGCRPTAAKSAVTGDAAGKVYVKPGSHDEFYNFVSGGFSGQLAIYGLPSGRLLREVPVFSQDPRPAGATVRRARACS